MNQNEKTPVSPYYTVAITSVIHLVMCTRTMRAYQNVNHCTYLTKGFKYNFSVTCFLNYPFTPTLGFTVGQCVKIFQPTTVRSTSGDCWYIRSGVCVVRAGGGKCPNPHMPFSANNQGSASCIVAKKNTKSPIWDYFGYNHAAQTSQCWWLNSQPFQRYWATSKIIPGFVISPFHSLISNLKIFTNAELTRNHAHSSPAVAYLTPAGWSWPTAEEDIM